MVKKGECICEPEKKSTKYVRPGLSYWEDIEVVIPDNLAGRDAIIDDQYFPVACFYEWETGTVIDCRQWGNEWITYTVMLDIDLGSQYDDVAHKCITLSEKYLKAYDWEEVCEKEKELDTIGSIKSLAEEKLNSEDINDVLIANVMLGLIDKAKKYDDLQK